MRGDLTIRDVEVEGVPGLDVQLRAGRIAVLGPRLPGGGETLDGQGGALIPGLADHHIHLAATAARMDSVVLDDCRTRDAVAARLRAAAAGRPPTGWIRAVGYQGGDGPLLSRADLDAILPGHPARVQDRTGALWIVNTPGLLQLGGDLPSCVERDAWGEPTGRIWRGDAWLRDRIGAQPPAFAPLGRLLLRQGITAVTDASASNTAASAAMLAAAHRAGDLPQRLTIMSAGRLPAPAERAYAIGPVKILLDERALPDFDDFCARIAQARRWSRPVAVHCVTAAELSLTLAAFAQAGARPGDRIEHGSVIPPDAIPAIARLGLAVVSQPGFVHAHGDRYLDEVDPVDRPDLYRCASLRAAGIIVAGSSDAPYGGTDPWHAMAAAVRRVTRGGRMLGADERIDGETALGLYLGEPRWLPARRRLEPGTPADLCLLRVPLHEAARAPSADLVRATIIDGKLLHLA